MTDEKYEYFRDQASKSIIARSSHAKYKRQNNFNSYSNSDLKKRNGECVTYNLGKPMKWKEFKAMPEEHQRTYLQNFFDKGVSVPELSKMFGVSTSSIKMAKSSLNVTSSSKAGAHMTKAAKKWWDEFNHGSFNKNQDHAEKMLKLSSEVSWDEFLTLDEAQQTAFLQTIIDEWNVGLNTISIYFFGLSKNMVANYVKRKHLDLCLKGERGWPSQCAKKRFLEALGIEEEKKVETVEELVAEPVEDHDEKLVKMPEVPSSSLRQIDFMLSEYDEGFINTILKKFEGRKIRIYITIREDDQSNV